MLELLKQQLYKVMAQIKLQHYIRSLWTRPLKWLIQVMTDSGSYLKFEFLMSLRYKVTAHTQMLQFFLLKWTWFKASTYSSHKQPLCSMNFKWFKIQCRERQMEKWCNDCLKNSKYSRTSWFSSFTGTTSKFNGLSLQISGFLWRLFLLIPKGKIPFQEHWNTKHYNDGTACKI